MVFAFVKQTIQRENNVGRGCDFIHRDLIGLKRTTLQYWLVLFFSTHIVKKQQNWIINRLQLDSMVIVVVQKFFSKGGVHFLSMLKYHLHYFCCWYMCICIFAECFWIFCFHLTPWAALFCFVFSSKLHIKFYKHELFFHQYIE